MNAVSLTQASSLAAPCFAVAATKELFNNATNAIHSPSTCTFLSSDDDDHLLIEKCLSNMRNRLRGVCCLLSVTTIILSQVSLAKAFSTRRYCTLPQLHIQQHPPSLHRTSSRWQLRCTRHLRMSSSSSNLKSIKMLEPGTLSKSELEVKKSKFIGYAAQVDSWDDAVNVLARVTKEHPKARHVCHGFKCGSNERCSDDGEPSGTAGLPILGAIKGDDLTNVVCIVVRYFGGIKLGAGGLIRAYGAAARQVIREAPAIMTTPKANIKVTVGATFIGAVYEAAAKSSATPSGEDYGADGNLTLTITCDAANTAELSQNLRDSTRGEVCIVRQSDS
ncbi:hypothetical protein MPSEU_001099300 [Mayamaea pseudoterrestris]|nr:hypothetical protein MPSEU_001099300 [Mayamaea pseudoterrestris]